MKAFEIGNFSPLDAAGPDLDAAALSNAWSSAVDAGLIAVLGAGYSLHDLMIKYERGDREVLECAVFVHAMTGERLYVVMMTLRGSQVAVDGTWLT